MTLRDQIVLVTGASSGIGRAIARASGAAGADLVLTYWKEHAKAEAVAEEIRAMGRRVCVLPLDLADSSSIARLASAAREQFGRVDAWINNAGADILTGSGASLSVTERLDKL